MGDVTATTSQSSNPDGQGVSPAMAATLESIPAPLMLLDAEERIVFANAPAVSLFGCTRSELLKRLLGTWIPGGLRGARWRSLGEFLRSPDRRSLDTNVQQPGRRKDGTRVALDIDLSVMNMDGASVAVCVLRDVAAQGGQDVIARSEARLNEAQRIARIGSWTWDIVNDEHWWSAELYRMLQIDPDEEARPFERFVELVHPLDRQRVREGIALARGDGPERPQSTDVRLVLPDGTQKVFHTQGEVIADEAGKPVVVHGTLQDITERKAIETALHLTEMRYREAQRIAKIGNWEWDLATNTSWWSEELYRILEEDPRAYPATFDNFLAKVHPDDQAVLIEGQRRIVVGTYPPAESRLVLRDGRQKIVEQLVQVRLDAQGQPVAVIGTIHDITERRALENQLRESEARYASTVQLAAVGIAHVDLAGQFVWSNRRFQEMLGYSPDELSAMTTRAVSHPDDVHVTDRQRALLHAGEIDTLRAEKRYVRKDGSAFWVRITSALRRGPGGEPLYHISVVEDITGQRIAQERVQYLATHDELTGLPNRSLFAQVLEQAIETARRDRRECAVLFIDLDRFKIVNDSLGHEAGDLLLKEVAARLARSVRTSDVVARLGGDEFVVLLDHVTDLTVAAEVARKILSSVLAPVEIMGHECRITGSIGVAAYPLHARDAATLMKHADTAMYLAKEEGKNNYQFYAADSSPMSVTHLVLESHLARALERREFSLQYQPRVDIATGTIKGTEALLRWWNPELGTVSPAQFIPLAEDTGLIVSIGKWVLRTACEQNVAWQRRGLPGIVMSVNISPRQFRDSALLGDIAEVLRETGMAPELLELEITESMIMHNVDLAAEKAAAIKKLGVRLAVDDFGTGYSSLSQLKRFPIDTLKIDRSFVRDIPQNADDRAITETIISLGKALGVTVVAEGVETAEQFTFLRDHDCDEMQGFLFSKPCHPDALVELLETIPVRARA
jgi:diguanylate cyclase (GGDEF)-like protein/PAS domain S-box-containing protein